MITIEDKIGDEKLQFGISILDKDLMKWKNSLMKQILMIY